MNTLNTFKTLLLFTLGGTVVGDVLGTLLGRSLIPWYYTPGHGQQLVSAFPETAQAIIGDLIRFQAIGSGVGLAAGLAAGVLLTRTMKRRAAAKAAANPGSVQQAS